MAVSDHERCRRCIVPASLPSADQDETGVCSFYRRFDELESRLPDDHWRRREAALRDIVAGARRLNREYDCLVPLSGGKDSAFALHLCANVYGMRCLCYTFDNGYLSEHARRNIINAVRATKSDHHRLRPDTGSLARQYGLFLRNCGTPCPVCMRGIQAGEDVLSRRFRPPLVVSGSGRRISYLNTVPELFQGGERSFYRRVLAGEDCADDLPALHTTPFRRRFSKAQRMMYDRLGVGDRMAWAYTRYLDIYDYVDVDFGSIRATIERELGWTAPDGEFEHMDCRLHGVASFAQSRRVPRLSPRTLYHSNLIRLGQLTREEALRWDREYFAADAEPLELEKVLGELEVTRREFDVATTGHTDLQKYRSSGDDALRRLYRRMAAKD